MLVWKFEWRRILEKRKPRQQYYMQRAEWTVLKTTRLKYPVYPLVTWLPPERASLIPQHHDTDEPTGRYAASCSWEIRRTPVPFPNKSSDMHSQCWTRFASRVKKRESESLEANWWCFQVVRALRDGKPVTQTDDASQSLYSVTTKMSSYTCAYVQTSWGRMCACVYVCICVCVRACVFLWLFIFLVFNISSQA